MLKVTVSDYAYQDWGFSITIFIERVKNKPHNRHLFGLFLRIKYNVKGLGNEI